MKLENRFTVPVPRNEAWKVLLDVERIAPCLPGAKLLSRDGDSFTGQVKVKLGPINLTYGGQAKFVHLDEAGGVAVIDASGKETRGTGTAKATITARLLDKGSSTDIEVDTDLAITGKPAQFGRGVLADVSAKLVDQFAACLSEEIQEGTPSGPPAERDAATGLSVGPPLTSGMDIAVEETAAHAQQPAAPAPEEPEEPAQPGAPVGAEGPAGAGTAPAPAVTPVSGTAAASSSGVGTPAPAASVAADGSGAPTTGAPTAGASSTGPSTAGASSTGASSTAPSSTVSRPPRQQAEAIDLLGTAGMPVAKRLVPALAALAVLALLVRALRR